MRLYAGMSEDFVSDATHNRIAGKLTDAFIAYYRFRPAPSEVSSWRNSLRAMSLIVQDARLNDHGVILEYQLPMNSRRLDFLVCAEDQRGKDQAIIVELKQWEGCEASDIDDVVMSALGGQMREVLHPSVQVGQYHEYLLDNHSAFHEEDSIRLHACAYLHNYSVRENDPLFAAKFSEVIRKYRLFDAAQSQELSGFLQKQLSGGAGRRVLSKIDDGQTRPSKKLMEHLSGAIRDHSPWVLLDEQLVIYQKVRAAVRKGLEDQRKRVVMSLTFSFGAQGQRDLLIGLTTHSQFVPQQMCFGLEPRTLTSKSFPRFRNSNAQYAGTQLLAPARDW